MNTINSVIFQVGSDQVITVLPEIVPIPSSQPGQKIALLQVDEQPYIFPKFAYLLNNDRFLEILPQETLNFNPGQSLIFSQPTGCGFTKIENQARLLMINGNHDNSFLFNLIHHLPISKKIEVSVLTTRPSYNYPEWVELITRSQLIDTSSWANRIFLEATQSNLDEVIQNIISNIGQVDQKKVEIFTQANYGCWGIGECGICSASIFNRNIHLCQQGPVLKLADYLRK